MIEERKKEMAKKELTKPEMFTLIVIYEWPYRPSVIHISKTLAIKISGKSRVILAANKKNSEKITRMLCNKSISYC